VILQGVTVMPEDVKAKSDKKGLPSRHTTVGPERAPHRAFLYAMGVTEDEVYQPLVGVATTWNEAAPCNITGARQAHLVKLGVRAAGGTPREFTTITVTDGIAMGHAGMKSSLVSREIIADSIELTMRGHCYDALVGLAGCDKSLPGLMMAMVRLNVASVFMYGGSILPGRFKGKDVTIVDVFEGVGRYAAGKMSGEDLHLLEMVACPSGGSCGGQFTANTMACVSEAIGLALPGPGGDTPAGERHPTARHRHPRGAGERRYGGRRHRWLDQCRAAPARDRQRGRHRLRPTSGGRHIQTHALDRQP
jgi:dihydroxy-acid dehydratase